MYSKDNRPQLTSACGLKKGNCTAAVWCSGETPIYSAVDLNLSVPFMEPLLKESAMAS